MLLTKLIMHIVNQKGRESIIEEGKFGDDIQDLHHERGKGKNVI